MAMFPEVMDGYTEKRKYELMLERMDGKKLVAYKPSIEMRGRAEAAKKSDKPMTIVDVERIFGKQR